MVRMGLKYYNWLQAMWGFGGDRVSLWCQWEQAVLETDLELKCSLVEPQTYDTSDTNLGFFCSVSLRQFYKAQVDLKLTVAAAALALLSLQPPYSDLELAM